MPEEANQVQKTTKNETKVVAGEQEFGECVAEWNKRGIQEHIIQQIVKEKINSLEEYGANWERLVSGFKKARYAVLGKRSRTDDVLFLQQQCLLLK